MTEAPNGVSVFFNLIRAITSLLTVRYGKGLFPRIVLVTIHDLSTSST